MKVSVVVPVYREPKYLADIAQKMEANHHLEKEIVAVVDGEMTPSIQETLDLLGSAVTVIFPGKHLGKAGALNQAAQQFSTDVLLFLDNDVLLPDDPEFLSRLAAKMERFDIVEMPKEVLVESMYSSMISYEYQSLALASLTFAGLAGRSPGIIGSAFAVKKELFDRMGGFRQVVHEDGDFGARAFRLKARYAYDFALKVKTSMPNSLGEWVTQRKRWALINVLWFKENFLHLLASAFKQPALIPTLGLIALPSVISVLLFLVLNLLNLSVINPVFFMVGQPFQFAAGIFFWLAYHELFSQGLLSTALGFLATMALYGGFSLKFHFKFNPLTFVLFYFFYTPLLVAINLVMFVIQLRSTRIRLDWKT